MYMQVCPSWEIILGTWYEAKPLEVVAYNVGGHCKFMSEDPMQSGVREVHVAVGV